MYKIHGLMFIPISNTYSTSRTDEAQKYMGASWAELYPQQILTEEEILKRYPEAVKMKTLTMKDEIL